MAFAILSTKLFIPPVRPDLVSRPRLIQRLNAGLTQGNIFARKLTLVSAPAGFGKTMLLSEWAAGLEPLTPTSPPVRAAEGASTQPRPALHVAWVSLDEGDNDAARFFAYLVAALQTIEPDIGESVLSTFQDPQPPPWDAILTSLINEIAAAPYDGTQDHLHILMLDDYHLITAQPIHDAIEFLLEHLPSNLHVVLAARSDPSLHLARLRGRGQLVELRQADLRFTTDEISAFFGQAMGRELSADNITALALRTEGWITGLQMAAIAMRSRLPQPASQPAGAPRAGQDGERVGRFIQAFTGSNRYILDYLVEEVLQRQPDGLKTFLLQTAILDRLTGPLCDAVTGQKDSASTLDSIERANLFITPLDDARRWYRYHRLFSDLLRQRLQRTSPELVPVLHRRASEWHAHNGQLAPAIDHALHARDHGRAAQLIEEHAEAIWGRGGHATLLGWMRALPDQSMNARPQLRALYALALFLSGQLDASEQQLSALEGMVGSRPDKGYDRGQKAKLGMAAAVRAFIGLFQEDANTIFKWSQRAFELLPDEHSMWRSIGAIALGDAYSWSGDPDKAIQAYSQALAAGKAAGNIFFALTASAKLAVIYRSRGQLQRVVDMCREQLQLVQDSGFTQPARAGSAYALWGEALCEWNELDRALSHVEKGCALCERGSNVIALGFSQLCLLRVLLSRKDWRAAEKAIDKLERVSRERDVPAWVSSGIAATKAHMWIAQAMPGGLGTSVRCDGSHREGYGHQWTDNGPQARQRLEAAAGLLRERGLRLDDDINYLRMSEYVTLARLLIAQALCDDGQGRGNAHVDTPARRRPVEPTGQIPNDGAGANDETLAQALRLLERLLALAEGNRHTSRAVEILIVRALAFQVQGDSARAMTSLERALGLAEPERSVRAFLDEGAAMANLLHRAVSRGIGVPYATRLLEEFERERKGGRLGAKARDLPPAHPRPGEALSERELEVLRLLTTHLSGTEIAEELFIASSTVRSHVKNIYAKLDVHSRNDAIQRARELALL